MIIASVIVFAVAAGLWTGTTVERARHSGVPPEQAWDSGCQHGLRLAHQLVASYPKPWITFGEERGWDLARNQLTSELAHLLDEALPNESNTTGAQAPLGGVS